ncbi:MAG: GNAT family N-acetyltransferase, partial [Aquamicrobium sp.]|nr:GNAT family N-acetyltransferase [Aquamicrobium sp.]
MVLRRLSPADLDAFGAYRADPELGRYQGWQPMDREASLAFLRAMAAEPSAAGAWVQVGIARRDDDRLVGDIGMRVQGDG